MALGPRAGEKPDTVSGAKGLARSMREAQPYIDAVWQFLASVGVMSWLGWWADGRLDTKPWLLLTGVLLGFAAGIWGFIKVLMHRSTPPGSSRDGTNNGPSDGAKP